MHTKNEQKTRRQFSWAIVFMAVTGLGLFSLPQTKAESEESLATLGLRIAPVALNLHNKNVELVGYGSFLVNVAAGCPDCHSAGAQTFFVPGGNPYFGQKPTVINPATYLGGGNDFGPLIPGTANIVSRNLTPDKTGRPAGGHTYDEFRKIMNTGVDMDKVHPNCTGAPNSNCLLAPFDGDLLQIMPWPSYTKMKEHEIRAIYEYLRAVPCISGPPAPSILHNDCQ
jgi:hypothetical protein